MANVCTFEMRIRGTKENCEKMMNSDIYCYELYVVDQKGTEEDYMMLLEGECKWSVTGSMVNTDDDQTLAAKAEEFDIELEVIGYDISEPEWIEHYHYKGAQCLREYNLYPYFMEWQLDETDLSDEDKAKYELVPEQNVYVLKKEYEEKFEWDEEEERMIVEYAMSFDDMDN